VSSMNIGPYESIYSFHEAPHVVCCMTNMHNGDCEEGLVLCQAGLFSKRFTIDDFNDGTAGLWVESMVQLIIEMGVINVNGIKELDDGS
jgi:hypothetical protein